MKKTFPFLFLFLGILNNYQGNSQKISSALSATSATQKIYIHYDKEYYVAGEIIWFKAYLYSDGKPSALSNNLFLQLTNDKGQPVSNKRIPVLGAVAKGSITIPDSLPQGNYYVRAVTPEMLNYDEPFIYKKNIFIFNQGSSNGKAITTPQNISVQFFPESGYMVDGILTVLGFKATDQWGIPVEVNGIIHSDDGTTIASFKSYHDGIGKVQFKPQAGKKYTADVETDAGKRTYALPEVKTSGINLKIQDEKSGKKFQLSRSEKEKEKFETIIVVAEINNHVVYENEISFDNYPSVIGHIVTDSLPSGILHFTVFNTDYMPLAERLCFVDNQEYVSNGNISSVKISTEKRAENSVEINFADIFQRSCSVSITDAAENIFSDNESIYSRLLLTSDLKGYVYNPSWYFENRSDTSKLAIDNLLLTQGWSRFSWTKILSGTPIAKKYSDQPFISITGKVTDEKNKDALLNGGLNIYAETEDSLSQNYEVKVDAAGKFKMDSLFLSGKTKLFYTYTDNKGKVRPALITIDENPLQQAIEIIPAGMLENVVVRNNNFKNSLEINKRYDYIKSQIDDVKELEKVTVKTKSNKKPIDLVNEQYANGIFKSEGKVELDNINNPVGDKSMNAVDYITNRIQQVEVQNNKFVNRKNMSLMSGQKWLIGIFLNDAPADIFQLRILRATDIALVKFYEAGFVAVGSSFPGGAIAVYTKERSENESKPDKLSFVEYKGYSISKEFYTPDYNNKDIKHPLTDNRTTLYWNPNVYTDDQNKSIRINFFNNDFSRKFKIVAEGFDAMGKLIHIEKIITN